MEPNEGPTVVERHRATEPHFELTDHSDEIAHLVCCRGPDWSVALCGEVNTSITLSAEMLCSMCVEVAASDAGWDLRADPPRCFRDGEPCPDEPDIDLRILDESGSR